MHCEGRDAPRAGFRLVDTTPYSRCANLSAGGPGAPRCFLSYRRAAERGHDALGVTDICLVMPGKGESTPHTFSRVERSLNSGTVRGGARGGHGGGGAPGHTPSTSVGVGDPLSPVVWVGRRHHDTP